jgi:hypothetical protein
MKPDPAMQRLAQATAATQGRNPSVVLEAFVPKTDLVVSVQDLLRLERIGSPLLLGGRVSLADWIIAHGVLTAWTDLEKAWRKNALEKWVDAQAAILAPGDLTKLTAQVSAAIEAALKPSTADQGSDPEKKSSAESVGGSSSSPPSAPTTSGANATS